MIVSQLMILIGFVISLLFLIFILFKLMGLYSFILVGAIALVLFIIFRYGDKEINFNKGEGE